MNHERLTFSILVCQRFLNKVGCLFEVDADVEVIGVAGRYAVVDDPRAGVELGVGIDVHEGVALCRIQDVGDAQTLQAHHVRRHKPEPAAEIHDRSLDGSEVSTCTCDLLPV